MGIVLHSFGTLFGIGLLLFYALVFSRKIKLPTQGHLFGIIFITLASASYLIQASYYVAYGPTVELDWFYGVNHVHGNIIFFFGFFYPFALFAFTIQVVTWVEFSFKVKMIKTKYRQTLVRLGFGIGMVVMFIFTVVVSAILVVIGTRTALKLAFSIYLGVYLIALLLFSAIYGWKMLKVVWKVKKSSLVISSKDGTSKTAISEATIRMIVLVFVSCGLLLSGAIVAIFSLFPQYNREADWYFAVVYAATAIQSLAVYSIEITFLWMMISTMKTNPEGRTFGSDNPSTKKIGSWRISRNSRSSKVESGDSRLSKGSDTSAALASDHLSMNSGQLSIGD